MKRQFARTVLVGLIVLASIVSYVYLNTVDLTVSDDAQYQLIENEEVPEEETAENTKLLLPDVNLIKKVIETGRSLVPGS